MKKYLSTPIDGGTLVVMAMLFTTLGLTVGEDWGAGQTALLVSGVVLALVGVIRMMATAAQPSQEGETEDGSC